MRTINTATIRGKWILTAVNPSKRGISAISFVSYEKADLGEISKKLRQKGYTRITIEPYKVIDSDR